MSATNGKGNVIRPSIWNHDEPLDLDSVSAERPSRWQLRRWERVGTCTDKGKASANVGAAALTPNAQDPLEGLQYLGPIAVRSAKRIRELAALPVDWVWQDYAVSGTIVVLAGPSTEGKTTLLFLILLARATLGEPIALLGRTIKPAPPGRYIVVIEAEHGDTSTCRKIVKSADLLGLGDDAIERVITVSRKAVTLGSPAWNDVKRMIKAGLVSDVALDTIARVAPGDGNSEKEQTEHFAQIAKAIESAPSIETQPIVWVLAHTRKGNADALEDVSGSTQRVAQADTVIMVRAERADTGQVVASNITLLKPREEPDVYPDKARLEIRDGKIVCSGADTASRPGLQGKILDVLRKHPTDLRSINYLVTATKRNAKDVEAAVDALVDADLVECADYTYRGKVVEGFRLAVEPDVNPNPGAPDVDPNASLTPVAGDRESGMFAAGLNPDVEPDGELTRDPD